MALDGFSRGIDRLHEIRIKIHTSHLTYLQTDDSPSKIQKRHKLEGFIKEYLCLVPNDSKYVFQETSHILRRSAATLNEFSGYRASEAWSAISMYASNLLAQPWRKEYRTLRTYSGYYKHEIEANLIGAELMFELMGYKHTGLGVLTLEGPIDPDKVSNVSRDAIVAFVECEILKQIWECVSKSFTVSWLEVLEFREKHAGGPEQAIRALNHRFLERIHPIRVKSDSYRDFHHSQPSLMDTVPLTTAPFHIISNSFNSAPVKASFCYQNEPMFSPNCGSFYPITPVQAPQGNVLYPGMHPGMLHHQPRVPTEKLIEFDDKYDKIFNQRTSQKDLSDQVDYSKKHLLRHEERIPIKTSTSLDSATNESWDYVYEGLGNIGYSKDIGDREDVLRRDEKLMENDKYRAYITTEYDSKYLPKSAKNPPPYNKEKYTNGQDAKKKINMSFNLGDSNGTNEEKIKNTSQPKNHQKIIENVKSLSVGLREETKKKVKDNRWACHCCTFLNAANAGICEICGKSRRKGNEDKPLESGGKQCPQCTLINEKNASKCEACNICLENSPTYV